MTSNQTVQEANRDQFRFADGEDELIFADEGVGSEEEGDALGKDVWKVIIVDDEQEIHRVTKLVLSDFEFAGKTLAFHSAYTAADAKKLFMEHPDAALVLLDVVMEEEDSGLKLVRFIREELKNQTIRVILRTGQPGQAPEKTIIMDYDINDYKEKTELTSQKLFTTVVSSLRTFRDMKVIEKNKNGLEEIIKSSATIFELQSMRKFARGVLTQLTSIINLNKNALHCSLAVTKEDSEIYILAATGDYSSKEYDRVSDVVPITILKEIEDAFREKRSKFFDSHFVYYFQSKTGSENVIYLSGRKALNEWDRYLIEIYCANVSVAFENIYLNEEVEHTQKEIIFTMGEITETRSKETGYHVKRVAEYSKLLALKYGLSEEEAEIIRLASPLHDVGKVGIPDSILNKPGKLTDDEFDTMKNHAGLGYSMLKHSNTRLLNAAATIAFQHHEKFNGKGYPNGLKGDDIHIYGRITAIADVFDALGSERVYKKAWELDRIIELLRSERGEHFDPVLVDLFLGSMDEVLAIRNKYPDQKVF
ncbi:DUF3369 domain-containing protein [Paenibacillus contaminans]|uniref:Phosphodiesterase n=1 Tax=Paenibacillus contaminans TaxID=450362 RepID=A0A329MM73_9BACL|nr:DUF3369 domain-containing protein [Paenibacillus contaminans]RAV20628.1 hypothetical protein DQG23_14025 [Paenibacillus contaminans]